jgi:hypothetical protein
VNTRDKALAKAQELGVEVNQEYARFAIELTAPKGKIFPSTNSNQFIADYNPEAKEVRRMAWRKVIGALASLENGGKK